MNQEIGWCNIPPQIMARKDLSQTAKMLFGRLVALSTQKGYCFASNKYLGTQIGIEPRQIRRVLSELQEKGFVKREIDNVMSPTQERRIYLVIQWGEGVDDRGGGRKRPPTIDNRIEEKDKDKGGATSVAPTSSVSKALKVIALYFKVYKSRLGEDHPPLSQVNLREVVERLESWDPFDQELDWLAIIEKHFETDYYSCDWNINHFANEGILQNRFFEECH